MALNPDFGVPSTGAHNQTTTADNTTVKTVSLATNTRAIYVGVTSKKVYMTFDGSTPSSTNGLGIVPDALPMYISVGSPTIKWISSDVAGSTVNVLCLV